jgi:hypothetical protein
MAALARTVQWSNALWVISASPAALSEISLDIVTKKEPVVPMAKKPILSIDEPSDDPKPKKTLRADRPPTEGFVTIVDGHFKSEFDTAEAAEASGRKLKSAYPMLQIEIYDADKKVRTLLSEQT